MAAADYRLMTEATGQRIAAALENLAGFGSYLTTADIVNNLTSTATNKPLSAAQGKALYDDYYTGRIFSQIVTCTYLNSNQLNGTFTTPSAPTGYTVRTCFARNLFSNNELGVKCTDGFLIGADYLRVRGSGFTTTDTLDVRLYWEYIKA